MKTILLIHGPNLNRLGERDPEHYGDLTLEKLEDLCAEQAEQLGWELIVTQSNHEGELIDFIQDHPADGIIINAGAYTHTSYALHDALMDADTPTIEVHLSDVENREDWRKTSVIAPACIAKISGKKEQGYIEAFDLLKEKL